MFTGIVETIGTVRQVQEKAQGKRLSIIPDNELDDLKSGDSLCVNGACLTVEQIQNRIIRVFAAAETLQRTTLKGVRIEDQVNLERALKIGDRLGGHWVTGHVDCVGKIVQDKHVGESLVRWICVHPKYMAQIAEKGSVTVDGVSLTIAGRKEDRFSVSLIPFTLAGTGLAGKSAGDEVNIETDILAKYAQLAPRERNSLTVSALEAMGYA